MAFSPLPCKGSEKNKRSTAGATYAGCYDEQGVSVPSGPLAAVQVQWLGVGGDGRRVVLLPVASRPGCCCLTGVQDHEAPHHPRRRHGHRHLRDRLPGTWLGPLGLQAEHALSLVSPFRFEA